MSPNNKKKLNLLRNKLDKIDYQLLKVIKKRTEVIKKVLKLDNSLDSSILIINLLNLSFRKIKFLKKKNCACKKK